MDTVKSFLQTLHRVDIRVDVLGLSTPEMPLCSDSSIIDIEEKNLAVLACKDFPRPVYNSIKMYQSIFLMIMHS